MTAFKVALAIDQGADYSKTVTWKVGSAKTPVDLTGCTAHAQFRVTVASPNVLLDLTTSNGGIVLGGPAGTVELVIASTQTEGVTWTKGFYDVEITFSGGKKRRLFEGAFTLSKEVTRA